MSRVLVPLRRIPFAVALRLSSAAGQARQRAADLYGHPYTPGSTRRRLHCLAATCAQSTVRTSADRIVTGTGLVPK